MFGLVLSQFKIWQLEKEIPEAGYFGKLPAFEVADLQNGV